MPKLAQQAHTWNGVSVVLTKVRTECGLFLATGSETHAKIALALEHQGERCDTRLHWDRPGKLPRAQNIVHYLPANVPTWCVSKGIRRLRHLALMIDMRAMPQGLSTLADHWPDEPRLGLISPAMLSLGRLLASEVEARQPHDTLYGDSLVLAMFAQMSRSVQQHGIEDNKYGLRPRQLARVVELMQANLSKGIELQTLADLTGLSQSHFCAAFKRSTGLPPYRFFMMMRVERAQEMLLTDRAATLLGIAGKLGFADQSHFTRVFRGIVGVSPSIWRAQRLR